MGSQQLLLIILGVIVVGISVVIGITIFGKNAQQANADAVIEDIMRIGTAAQAYAAKPRSLGGGSGFFTGLTLQKCGWKSAANANGTYSLYRVRTDRVRVQGIGNQNVTVRMTFYSDSVGNPLISYGLVP